MSMRCVYFREEKSMHVDNIRRRSCQGKRERKVALKAVANAALGTVLLCHLNDYLKLGRISIQRPWYSYFCQVHKSFHWNVKCFGDTIVSWRVFISGFHEYADWYLGDHQWLWCFVPRIMFVSCLQDRCPASTLHNSKGDSSSLHLYALVVLWEESQSSINLRLWDMWKEQEL